MISILEYCKGYWYGMEVLKEVGVGRFPIAALIRQEPVPPPSTIVLVA